MATAVSNDDSTLFLPLIDDPSYQLDNVPLLGVDLMDLFVTIR